MKIDALRTLTLLLASGFAAPGLAVTAWDETAHGDLSGVAGAPTLLVFGSGSNTVSGSIANPADTRDFLHFVIQPGFQLSALRLLSYDNLGTSAPQDGNRGYHAIQNGVVGLVPAVGNSNAFLGGDHLDPSAPGTDLLPQLGGANRLAGTGFSGPLGAGSYVYVVQQTGAQLNGYSLDFVVTPVPVPAALWLVTPALALMAARRRRVRA